MWVGRGRGLLGKMVLTGLKGCKASSYLLANRGRLLTNLSSLGELGAEEVEEAGEEGSEKAGE